MIRAPFFSSSVYRDVARNWGGINFWYLLLLLLVTWMIVMIKLHLVVAGFVRNDFPSLVQDVPPITISNGKVSSPVKQPYFLQDSSTHKNFAVIDTTGTINSLDDTDALLLLTENKVWTRQSSSNPAGDVRQYDLSKVKYFYLDKNKLTIWMTTISHWLALSLFPVLIVVTLTLRLIQALIYGGLIMAISNGLKADLTFGAAMRLAIVSVTPVILLDTVLWVGGWTMPAWSLIGIAIAGLYMVMCVKANSRPPSLSYPPTPAQWPPQNMPPSAILNDPTQNV